jgi:hypothetical protein
MTAMSDTDASISPAHAHNESSIFFTLPPELRNLVYEYTLTHEQDVHARTGPLGQPTLSLISKQELITDANALQYVCLKTHQETRGLALRYNDLVIRYQTSCPALAVCVDFLHAVAAKYHSFIRRIDLVEKSGLHPPITSLGRLRNVLSGQKYPSIHRLCLRQPATLVIVRLDFERADFDTYRRFAIRHAATSLYLRGHPGQLLRKNSILLPLLLEDHFRQPRVLYKEKTGEVFPDNYRFVLMNSIEGMVDRNEGNLDQWSAQAC